MRKRRNIFYVYLILTCLCCNSVVAQEDCEIVFDAIKILYEQEKWSAAKLECESYIRHCGSNAQVEQIQKECISHLQKKANTASQPQPKPHTKPLPQPHPQPIGDRFSVNKTYIDFSESGGRDYVNVTAEGSWSISSHPDWVDVQRISNTLSISCHPNNRSSAREGEIVLSDEDGADIYIIVGQDRNSDYIKLSANLIEDRDGIGGLYTITVNSSKPWRIDYQPQWCEIQTTQHEIKVSLKPNKSAVERFAKIEVVAQSGTTDVRRTIDVKQAVLRRYLMLSHNSFMDNTGKGAISRKITVDTDFNGFWIENVPWWCEIIDKTATSFAVKILKNNGGGARSAKMRVVAGDKSQDFIVSQVERYSYVNVNPQIINATKQGGVITIHVESSGSWRVINLPEWCQQTEQTANSFTLEVLQNEAAARTAIFYVSASGVREQIEVRQQ